MPRPQNCKRCNKPKRPKGNKFKDLPGYCMCGRRSSFTEEVVKKLEDAFSNAFNVSEACFYAGVSRQAYYDYINENPKMADRFAEFSSRPGMKAKRTVVNSLGDPNHAWKYLEKRDPDFKEVKKIEHTVETINENMSQAEKDAIDLLKEARRKRIEEDSDKLE